MAKRDIVVIGASAGGMEALQVLVAGLPRELRAALFVVWHMPSGMESTVLPTLLARRGPFAAAMAQDGEPIDQGRIYVARADHHLLVENGHVRVTKGPKENRFRPAVDPLFRSAAYAYGARVTGVVLTGALDDGTSGLWTIKLRGGTAIVQDPEEALHPSMPTNALQNVEVDYTLRLAEIGPLLGKLSREEAPAPHELPADAKRRLESEIRIAKEDSAAGIDILATGELSPFTCPECHGVLTRLREGSLLRFRCHTGHAFSSNALLHSLREQLESRVWDAVRTLDEAAMLLEHMGEHLEQAGEHEMARDYRRRAKEALERSRPLREVAQDESPA
jgi:two-component system chemotaxis response regulator CheB